MCWNNRKIVLLEMSLFFAFLLCFPVPMLRLLSSMTEHSRSDKIKKNSVM